MFYRLLLIFLITSVTWLPQQARSEDEKPYIMGSLGDSISAGFNAWRYGDNRELSWAGGLDPQGLVESHARRLKNQLVGRDLVVVNEAFVGAEVRQLQRQAARLLKSKPDYVTIAIGANDVCTWYEDYLPKLESYKQHLTQVIDRLIEANPKIKIVLLPVPSIPLMYELGLKRSGCQAKWDTMGVCKPILAADRTPQQRQDFTARFEHLNQTIGAIAAQYSINVRFVPEIAKAAFDDSMISPLDCFHPSIEGHNFISDLSFDPTWY